MSFILLLSRLPWKFLYAFSELTGRLLYRWIKYRHKVIDKNLAIAFPKYSKQAREHIKQRFYMNFSRTLVEIIKMATMSETEMKRRVKINNDSVALVEEFRKKGVSIVVLASHCANWEWILAGSSLHYSMQLESVVRVPSNRLAGRWIRYVRYNRYNVHMYDPQKVSIQLLRNNSSPRAHIIVGDQCPNLSGAKHWHPFLGKKNSILSKYRAHA